MASLLDLPGAATRILATFTTHLEALGVDVPERRYVAPGTLIPWDGEQLVVNLQQIQQGQPGAEIGTTYVPQATNLQAQFSVSIVRPVPALNADGPLVAMIPDSTQIGEAGTVFMSDAAALVRAALEIHTAYALTGPGEGFVIGPCIPLGPEGGHVGYRMLITLSLS